jgi:hypothetical protein
MPTLVPEVSLADLRDRFGLVRSADPDFFGAEFGAQPEVTAVERAMLDRVQQNYLSQLEVQSLNEETVKMVVVSPLLDLAGFYRSPFTIDSEVSVEIAETDDAGVALTGRIDTLIVRDRLWVLVVESKRSRFSVQAAIPQGLAYLLGRPGEGKSGYGLLTNGGEFLLVRVGGEVPTYGFSETFSLLNQGNDLGRVLGVLKQITALG